MSDLLFSIGMKLYDIKCMEKLANQILSIIRKKTRLPSRSWVSALENFLFTNRSSTSLTTLLTLTL